MKKKIFLFIIATTSPLFSIVCVPKSCDPTVSFAIAKETVVLKQRLGDAYKALKYTVDEQRMHNFYIVNDIFELMKARQRYRIRLEDAMKQSFLANKLANTIESGAGIQAVRAAAILEHMNKKGIE